MKPKRVKKIKNQTNSARTLILIIVLAIAALFSLTLVTQRQLFNPFAQTVGTQYYVDSVGGNDSNNGTAESTPWKSLSKVMNTNFSAGDVINFKRGSEWTEQFSIDSNGTQGNKITYQAYGTGAAPWVNAQATYAMTVGGSYNLVKDFQVSNGKESSIDVTGTNNEVSNNELTNSGSGLWMHGNNNLITHNNAHSLRMITNTQGGDDDAGAVGFVIEASGNEISYNTCTDCSAPSYDYGNDGGFVEVWLRGDNSYIHHNKAIRTNGFFELGGTNSGTANNIKIEYNIVDNAGSMLCAHTQGGFALPTANLTISNNTFINSADIACDMPDNLVVQNNIFSGGSFGGATGFTHKNNLFSSNPGTLGSGDKVGDPLFVNAASGDYHLQAGSPAIDAGLNIGLTKDFEDKAVPFGSAPDMGALEYGSTAIPTSGTSIAPSATTAPISPTYECIGGQNCVPSPTPSGGVTIEPTTIENPTAEPTQISNEPTATPVPGGSGGGGNSVFSLLKLFLMFLLSIFQFLLGNR